MRRMDFSTVLGQVLDTAAPRLGLARRRMAATLAAGIGTDRSLVYRWLRGDDVPSLRSGHVANIARFLELDRASAARLEQAQIVALQATTRPPVRMTKSGSGVTEAVRILVGPRVVPSPVQLAPMSIRPKAAPGTPVTTLHGRAEIVRAAIAALESLPECTPPGSRTIVISTQSVEPWWAIPGDTALRDLWKMAVSRALASGWCVREIWRLQQVERTIRLVETMIDLAGYDWYRPSYVTQYGLLRPPYDLLVIPDRVAFLLLGADASEHADAGFIFRDADQIHLLEAHARQHVAHTREFFTGFRGSDQELAFTRSIVASEAEPGGRRFVKDGLGALTLPPTWYKEGTLLARRTVETGMVSAEDLPAYLALLRKRWHDFDRRMRLPSNAYFEMCPRQAVELLIEQGTYPADEPFWAYTVPPALILQHMRHVVTMLRTYDQYHLALVDNETARAFAAHTTWGIQGTKVHITFPFHTADASGKPKQINLQIAEPHVTRAFRDYFDVLWHERIAEHEKDKAEIIAWLEWRMRMLELSE